MSIWIRSQDKSKLVEAHTFDLGEYFDEDVYADNIVVGRYSTKEKALKVLDMIQDAMQPKLIIDVDGRIEQTGGKQIFVMPQDDEVIV